MAQIISETPEARDVEPIRAMLEANVPDLHVASLTALGEGWMSRAFLVNGRYVFRFPKRQDGADDLLKEIALLPELAQQISLRIPRFDYIGKQPNGFPFVGYEIISGTLLDEASFVELSDTIKDRIATQLVEFMDQMQSFPLDRAAVLGVKRADMIAGYTEDRASIRRYYSSLPPELTDYIEQRYAEFLNEASYHHHPPKLVHADLALDHMVFDEDRQELSGIIDFGDTEIADPDYEYVYLLKEMGASFTKLVMSKRREQKIEEKVKKVGYLVTFNLVDDILGTELLGIPQSTKERAIKALTREWKTSYGNL